MAVDWSSKSTDQTVLDGSWLLELLLDIVDGFACREIKCSFFFFFEIDR